MSPSPVGSCPSFVKVPPPPPPLPLLPPRVAGYFRREGGTSAPSFRVTCPLKCHGAHQPAFLCSCAHCNVHIAHKNQLRVHIERVQRGWGEMRTRHTGRQLVKPRLPHLIVWLVHQLPNFIFLHWIFHQILQTHTDLVSAV